MLRADYGTRTRNPRITSTVRYQLRQVGGCPTSLAMAAVDPDSGRPAQDAGVLVGVGVGVGLSVALYDASLEAVSTNDENSEGSSSAPT